MIADMRELEVWEPLSVKVQTFKTAIEVCTIYCKSIEKYMYKCVASYDGTVSYSRVRFSFVSLSRLPSCCYALMT